MAKTQQTQTKGSTPVIPNFKDVDKSAVQAAMAAVSGGRQGALQVPADAARSEDGKGNKYARWNERGVVQQAYRSVTKKGLMDVTLIVKIRQSKTEANNGKKVFSHFYMNVSGDVPENHEQMNDRSMGAIATALVAAGLMPTGGALKGSTLDKMFPQKNQPGSASPLVGKALVVNVVQVEGPKKDIKTGKVMKDEDDNVVMEKRDNGESFLPDTDAVEDEDEDEDEN